MKIAIENFSTTEDTQCLYLSNAFNSIGHESIIFDQTKTSIYDIFDSYKPEIYITHAFRFSKDVLYYIENNNYDVDILLNINNVTPSNVVNFDKFFEERNIESSFFFTSSGKKNLPKMNRNILSLSHAADINLLNIQPSIEYSIDKAIFFSDKVETREYEGTYHTISNNPHIKDNIDIYLPEMSLAPLYKCYDEIIFNDFKGFFNQAFFDAVAIGSKVYFDIIDPQKIDLLNTSINRLFKEDFNLVYSSSDKLNSFTQLRNIILERHSPINRANSLLSNIKKKVLS